MKKKKKKLPGVLYHYTSPIHYALIQKYGALKPTPSNLKYGTMAVKPIIVDGEVIGEKHVDEYEHYHPVVWLTSNPDAKNDETGLNVEKTACRISIPTKGAPWRYLRWPEFCEKYHADPAIVASLKAGYGADWKSWYVCESEIPIADFSAVDFSPDAALYGYTADSGDAIAPYPVTDAQNRYRAESQNSLER